MKLQFPKIPTETSHVFENENFSLGDIRVIMNLLSSKIYSRPKYIIVQEVGSNARDANREAGRADTPIRVKLPSRLDDNFIIADNGIGISPARMSDVFLKYGNSTKRSDNVLTGGFGIGAKTPFTYTDSFTVVTITDDDDGVRRKRTYIAHKADDMFRMSLVTTEDTTEDTGTAIGFAVEPDDFRDFALATREVFRYWNPRPIVEGDASFVWPDEKIIHKGTDWELANTGGPKVLIDRIPYSLRLEEIFKDRYNNPAYNILRDTNVRLYFNTGEVDVSATREDLDYQARTIQAIKDKAEKVLTELQAQIDAAFTGCKSLWEASQKWHTNKDSYRGFRVDPKWNGKDMMPRNIEVPSYLDKAQLPSCPVTYGNFIRPNEHIKISVFEQDGLDVVSKKGGWRGRSIIRSIEVTDNIIVAVDDSGKSRPNKRRLITLFEKNPTVHSVAVVTFKTPHAEDIAKLSMFWDDIPHIKLSTVPKAPKVVNPNTGRTYTVNAVKVLEYGSRSWQWVAAKDRAPEDTDGGVYVLLKDGTPMSSSGTTLEKDSLEEIRRKLGCDKIYGILWKYRNKIDPSWTEVTAKATLKAAELRAKPEVAAYIADGPDSLEADISLFYEYFCNNKDKIQDAEFVSLLDRSKKLESGAEDYYTYRTLLVNTRQEHDQTSGNLKKDLKKISGKYSLIFQFERANRYSYSSTKNTIFDELIFYMNAKYAANNATQGDSNAND